MRLLPKDNDHGWSPIVWLIFLVFFFFHPIYDHVRWQEWVITALGAAVFLVLYLGVFWVACRRKRYCVAGMALLGLGYAPFNPGASTLFIYVASLIPFVTETPASALKLLATVLAVIGVESWLLHLHSDFWLVAYVISVPIGLGNIYFAQRNRDNAKLRLAQEEVEHLAKIAERERIARDLHDVLGHTLSLITLKSELAGRLFDRDPAQARAEIRDIEQTARKALADVRQAIGGYRTKGLAQEFQLARKTLETAGVAVDCETAPQIGLQPTQESVLALVVREAVTNVVRHASARHCRLRLEQRNGDCQLEIHDDGRGGDQVEGNGLRGMRERVEAIGGSVHRDTGQGTRLLITLPLSAAETGTQ